MQKMRRQSLMNDVGPLVCENTAAIVAGYADADDEESAYEEIMAEREKRRLSHRMSWSDQGPMARLRSVPFNFHFHVLFLASLALSRRGSSSRGRPQVCEVSDVSAGFDCEHEEELHRDHIIAHREKEKTKRQSTYESHEDET